MLSEQQKQEIATRDEMVLAAIEAAKDKGISMPELAKRTKIGPTLVRNSIRRMRTKVRCVGNSRARVYYGKSFGKEALTGSKKVKK